MKTNQLLISVAGLLALSCVSGLAQQVTGRPRFAQRDHHDLPASNFRLPTRSSAA